MILRKRTGGYIVPIDPIVGCTINYATNYNPLAEYDDGSCVYPDLSSSALIVESGPNNIPTHGVYVQQEFEIGFPDGESILRGRGLTDGFQFVANTNAGALIFSYGGLPFHISQALNIYPTTQMFMPLGSNDPVLISDPPMIPVIITCGAGSTHNITGYGPGLEFWDSETSGNPAIQSSLSNGKIAGLIMNIKQTLNCSWWQARARARITADRNETRRPPGVIWTQEDGFGKINLAAALAYEGEIIDDPFLNNGNVYWPFIG